MYPFLAEIHHSRKGATRIVARVITPPGFLNVLVNSNLTFLFPLFVIVLLKIFENTPAINSCEFDKNKTKGRNSSLQL